MDDAAELQGVRATDVVDFVVYRAGCVLEVEAADKILVIGMLFFHHRIEELSRAVTFLYLRHIEWASGALDFDVPDFRYVRFGLAGWDRQAKRSGQGVYPWNIKKKNEMIKN